MLDELESNQAGPICCSYKPLTRYGDTSILLEKLCRSKKMLTQKLNSLCHLTLVCVCGGDVSTRSFSTKKRFVQKLRELNKDKHNMYKILNDCLDYFHNTLIF